MIAGNLSIVFNLPIPLAAKQLLWINLVTDSLPAMALGVEKGEDDTNQLGEEEVFFTVKDYKEFIGDSKITKKDLAQIILL